MTSSIHPVSPANTAPWWHRFKARRMDLAELANHLRSIYEDYIFNSVLVALVTLFLFFTAPALNKQDFLNIWMVFWMLYLSSRFSVALFYPRTEPSEGVLLAWARLSVFIQMVEAALLMVLALGFYPSLDHFLQVILLMSALLLVGATAFSLAGRWLSLLVYAPVVYLSFAYSTWQQTHVLAKELAILVVGMFGFYMFYAYNQRKSMRKGFALAQQNGELAQELQKKNAELQEVAAARSRLLATVSHDLRQPAHAIGLLAERALMDQSPFSLQMSLRDLNELSQSLSASLATLMDMTRLDAGLVDPRVQAISMGQILLRLEAEFASSARNKGLWFVVDPTPAWVYSDPVLLHGMLANLVSNAIKYTRTGGVSVNVTVLPGEQLSVAVRDTGLGIHPDKLDHIFKEFIRLDHSDPGSEGLGLGLSIVRRYSLLLGHQISVESQPLRGSCFTATLRVAPPDADLAPEGQPLQTLPERDRHLTGLSGVRVLVVDNVDLLLSSMSKTLVSWGCVVVAAHNLPEALALIGSDEVDLAISDFHLGDREPNGLMLLAEVQALPQHRQRGELPSLLMTGDVSAQLEDDAKAQKIQVLHKPVRPAVLQKRLLALLQR